ncbi:MAG TPA: YifB family Mg chelatase-like AAA ATPase, partial [bacterium]|nr:YifB family Mg chelatase-like AAA ATPase [bacterium]
GALAVALLAKQQGWKGLILPGENAPEAALIEGLDVRSSADLPAVVEFLQGQKDLPVTIAAPHSPTDSSTSPDFSEVKGQAYAKRALEIAAAGFHPALMVGPPGSGKSLLASTLPSILTELSFEESLVTSRIHALCQDKPIEGGLMRSRPFRNPHHSVSEAGLIGGGSWPRPGEVSLAHHGVLFLDELPEFRRPSLETLRQPLENHAVTIVRARQRMTFPARFLLVAAMNPCPCGKFGQAKDRCFCPSVAIQRYQSRISGPLLDRFDLKVEVPPLDFQELAATEPAESGARVRARVAQAQERQRRRLGPLGLLANSQMRNQELRRFCDLKGEALRLLERAVEKWELSARAYHRILKVSRTIADLEGVEEISAAHVGEAVAYRCPEDNRGQIPQARAL